MISRVIVESLNVEIHEDDLAMAAAAAGLVHEILGRSIQENGSANLLLATGTSQLAFLGALTKENFPHWSKVSLFHLDEYIGITSDHPASFRKYLQERVVDKVKPGNVYFLHGDTKDLNGEISRYENLLNQHPIDIACIGIGENGHIAFNEPGNTDFHDQKRVRVIELDQESRQQQVGEGWFDQLSEVPVQALTLTVPAIMKSRRISCFVPQLRKAGAVKRALLGSVSPACPASILRTHPDTILYLDRNSASGIMG